MDDILWGCGFLTVAALLWIKRERVADAYFFGMPSPRPDWTEEWTRKWSRALPFVFGAIGLPLLISGLRDLTG